jgi:hypothetical protein
MAIFFDASILKVRFVNVAVWITPGLNKALRSTPCFQKCICPMPPGGATACVRGLYH